MKKTIGIDIGSHSLKLIELEEQKGRIKLTKCAIKPLSKEGIELDFKKLISSAKPSHRSVNISLSGPSVVVRYIEMPPMKKDELRSAIKFEAEKYIPFKIDESIVDCAILDKASSGPQRVLLAATKKTDVGNLMGLLKKVGLDINIIDVDSFALMNAFHRLKTGIKEDSTYALLNIGAKFSNMNIAANKNAYFTRDLLWGGKDITKRIQDAMNISEEEAEALKHSPGDKRQEVVDVITPVLERFSSQIRLSFDYYESQSGKGVDKLYISGGSSYLFNMVDFLQDSLAVDILMWDPFQDISIADGARDKEIDAVPALFAVSMGLALRK